MVPIFTIKATELSQPIITQKVSFKMKTLILSILLFVTIINHVSGQVNYCSLCRWHIACNHTGAFAAICPPDAIVVPLTQDEKDAFLNNHNTHRNSLAGGLIPGFTTAANISAVVSHSF